MSNFPTVLPVTLFILSYAAGLLTIASPCILPILPFVLARANTPFWRSGLPMLLGLAFAFGATASLAAFAGGWAVEANRGGRAVALALMTLFGLAVMFPPLAARITARIVAMGSALSASAMRRVAARGVTTVSSVLLGVGAGLIWAPCAGPVLGVVLTGAALRGPSAETSFLLLTYGLGAATSLAAASLLGGRLLAVVKKSMPWERGLRRALGAATLLGAATIWLGLDTSLLTNWSTVSTNPLEQRVIATLQREDVLSITSPAFAAPNSPLSDPLTALLGPHEWLNTQPLHAADLRGKVVLVNFWTYSCINCLRMLPYVRAWADKYRDQGLVVVGVHTPEFAFEKDVANVKTAVSSLAVGYPVAIDSDFKIWRAFNNQAWPALYFVGADGRVRHHLFGEGNYDEAELLIQQLLLETKNVSLPGIPAKIEAKGPEAAADERDLRSEETYIGYAQATNFASPGGVQEDAPGIYNILPPLSRDYWGLSGKWTIRGEYAALNEAGGAIAYRFHARDLHLVLASPSDGRSVRFRVTIDGAPPGADHGYDVDAEGQGSVQEDRLYQLVRQTGSVIDRTFEIQFFDAGVRAYAFTFG
jgi:cytochrome c biogenesis protein CcdA/thiol-disulfide isomerase/thioredoxin